MSDETSKALAEQNPYYRFSDVAEGVSPLLMKAYSSQPVGDRSTKELLGSSLVTGLLGGAFKAKGDDYQTTLRNRFAETMYKTALGEEVTPESENLPTGLFSKAQGVGRLLQNSLIDQSIEQERQLGLRQRLQNQELEGRRQLAREENEARRKELFTRAMLEDPDRAKIAIAELDALEGKPRTPPPSILGAEQEDISASARVKAEPTLQDKYAEKYLYARKTLGQSDAQARAFSKDIMRPEFEAQEKILSEIPEIRSKVQAMQKIADTANNVMGSGLETGWLNKKIDSALGFVGANDPRFEQLDSLSKEVMQLGKIPGAGTLTDKDMGRLLTSFGGSEKTSTTNKELARRLGQVADRSRQYLEFIEGEAEAGRSLVSANRKWAQYEKAAPLFIEKAGQTLPVKNIPPYTSFDFSSGRFRSGKQAVEQKNIPVSAHENIISNAQSLLESGNFGSKAEFLDALRNNLDKDGQDYLSKKYGVK